MASEKGIKNPQSDLCDKAEGIATYTDLVFLDAEPFRNCGDDLFVSNAERAQMAATGLIEFAKISGQHQHGTEPVRGIVISMLASTMHACHLLGVTEAEPFLSLVNIAAGHFEAEIRDEY